MKELLGAYTAAVVENADYAREIQRLQDNLLSAYDDGRASRDEEVAELRRESAIARAELAQLKTMPAAA
jgi:hypothetical protein